MSPSPSRFLALGDSYTIGESVPPSERWPEQLTARLRADGIPMADPFVIAQTGWTTDELAGAMDEKGMWAPTLARRAEGRMRHEVFDLVTLLVGVNNQYRGRSVEEYQEEFRGLLERAIYLAGDRPGSTIVLSIPDWGVMPFAEGRDRAKIAVEIDAFNTVNREEAARLGARYVDITGISREAIQRPELGATDGLHPSAEQYGRWTVSIEPVAREILRSSR